MQFNLIHECPGLEEVVGDRYYTRHRTSLSPLELCELLMRRAREWIKLLERFYDLLAQEYRQYNSDIKVVVEMGIIYLEGDFSDSLVHQLEQERFAYILDDELEDDNLNDED